MGRFVGFKSPAVLCSFLAAMLVVNVDDKS